MDASAEASATRDDDNAEEMPQASASHGGGDDNVEEMPQASASHGAIDESAFFPSTSFALPDHVAPLPLSATQLREDVVTKMNRAVDALGEHCGVAVCAVRGGEVSYQRAAGRTFGSSKRGRPVSLSHTAFMVASISKTFVALACLQAQERGELALDCDINAYVAPTLALPLGQKNGTRKDAKSVVRVVNPRFPSRAVTCRMLLTHTAGLVDLESALDAGSKYRTTGHDSPISLLDYVRGIATGGSRVREVWGSSPPGEAAYHYSNAGFTLLAFVLACATGRSLGSLCEQYIFRPLNMTSTCFSLVPFLTDDGESLTLAMPRRFGVALGHYNVAEWPAAGLRSTAHDLARYLMGFTSPNLSPLRDPRSLAQLCPPNNRAGLSWWGKDASYRSRPPERNVWEHGGFMDGVRTHMYFWPQAGVGLVLLTNGTRDYTRVVETLISALVPTDVLRQPSDGPASVLPKVQALVPHKFVPVVTRHEATG